MFKKMLTGIFLATLFVPMPSFANVDETRQVLSHYSEANPKVLETFDRIVTSWIAYESKIGNEWDLDKLLKSVEFAAEKHLIHSVAYDAKYTPYVIHPIGVSELLWDIGNIRSVNVLSSALLHNTLKYNMATEEEIKEIFGERVLYTVKEVSDDLSFSSQENKKRQIDRAPTMSLDGQLVMLADRLYYVKDLDPPPLSYSDAKVDEYYVWGEKSLSVLRGTNEGLEKALQKRIENHRENTTTQDDRIVGFHTVKGIYDEWDPYEGQYIERYIFILEDYSVWIIHSYTYNRNHLSLRIGDEVEITSLGNGQLLMIISSTDGSLKKSITFGRGYNCFRAI